MDHTQTRVGPNEFFGIVMGPTVAQLLSVNALWLGQPHFLTSLCFIEDLLGCRAVR